MMRQHRGDERMTRQGRELLAQTPVEPGGLCN
jgi:hypothetical protein